MHDYFKDYGEEDFAKKIGYKGDIDMYESWCSSITLNESDIADMVYESFDGIKAYLLTDQYDHENEDKLDQERGK